MTATTVGPAGLLGARRLAFLAKDTGLYGAVSALNKLLALVTFPILTRHFSVSDYGTIDALNFTGTLIAALVIFGQDSAMARFFYDSDDPGFRRLKVAQSLAVQSVVTLGAMAVLVPTAWWVGGNYLTGATGQTLAVLVVLQVPFLVLTNFTANLLKWTFSRSRFVILVLGQVATIAAALAVSVFWFRLTVVSVFIIYLIIRASFSVLGIWFCRTWVRWPSSRAGIGAMFRYAAPYGAISGTVALVPLLERSASAFTLGPDALGLYAAGAAVAALIMLPVQAFQTAWGPFALALHREKDAARTYDHAFRAFAAIMCVGVMALAVVAPYFVSLLASSRYASGAVVVFPVALAYAIQGIGWVCEVGIDFSKRTHLQLVAYAVFLTILFGGLLTLPRLLGLGGVAAALLVAHAAKTVTSARLAQSAYPLDWSYGPVVAAIGVTLALGGLHAWAVSTQPAPVAAGLGGVGLVLITTLAWFLIVPPEVRRRGLTPWRARAQASGSTAALAGRDE